MQFISYCISLGLLSPLIGWNCEISTFEVCIINKYMLQLPKHTMTYGISRYPTHYEIKVNIVDTLTRNFMEITHPIEQLPPDACFS